MTKRDIVSTGADIESVIISKNEKLAIVIMQKEPDEIFNVVRYYLHAPEKQYEIEIKGDYVKAYHIS